MKRRTVRAQVACYLSLNVIVLSDQPRLEALPLVTLPNIFLALRFILLALLPPARRRRVLALAGQLQTARLVAGIAAVVATELWRDLSKRYVLNVC